MYRFSSRQVSPWMTVHFLARSDPEQAFGVGVINGVLKGGGPGTVEGLGLLASDNFGVISGCWASGIISSPGGDGAFPGGLVGGNYGTIIKSYSATKITINGGGGITAGGLAGYNQGAIDQSYACLLYTSPSPRD